MSVNVCSDDRRLVVVPVASIRMTRLTWGDIVTNIVVIFAIDGLVDVIVACKALPCRVGGLEIVAVVCQLC